MLTEQQKEARKHGIGASETGTVMGLNKYKSPYQLWMVKTGKLPEDDLSSIPQVHWGSVLEEPIAQQYAERMGVKVRRVSETLFHKDHLFMLCHIDRKIEGQSKLLECKFAMFHSDEWGPDGSDIVPLTYILQVQHQLAVTGYEEADLAVLIGGWDFRIYHFKRDEDLIKKIIADLHKFWSYVQTNTPPPLRDKHDVEMMFPSPIEQYKEADTEILSKFQKRNELTAALQTIESEIDSIKDDMAMYMKDAEGIKMNNSVLVTWKPNVKGSRVMKFKEAKI